ncbi:MAG: biotin--[acetyl-CoA-carboxylase] ligase [Bacteroidota bacterium]|jgi:BirA family transcriptional regulator, biotin operon repressor / biotin---[acetyl-CoA-carboxylase] ligase
MKFSVTVIDSVDSTNAFARRMIDESKAGEGTVIMAREQYAGRGQGENTWHSQAGMNLTFSLVLEPVFLPPDKQFILNKAIALAVMNSVKQSLPPETITSIKWPNDIYAGTRKIAGILIEHTIMGNSLKHSIIGIGINLNQVEFPVHLPNPVSLKQFTGLDHDNEKFLESTCHDLDLEYSRLIRGEFNSINNDYDSSLFGYGSDSEFTSGSSSFTGRITGVDDLGRLLIMTQDGNIRSYNHGETVIRI